MRNLAHFLLLFSIVICASAVQLSCSVPWKANPFSLDDGWKTGSITSFASLGPSIYVGSQSGIWKSANIHRSPIQWGENSRSCSSKSFLTKDRSLSSSISSVCDGYVYSTLDGGSNWRASATPALVGMDVSGITSANNRVLIGVSGLTDTTIGSVEDNVGLYFYTPTNTTNPPKRVYPGVVRAVTSAACGTTYSYWAVVQGVGVIVSRSPSVSSSWSKVYPAVGVDAVDNMIGASISAACYDGFNFAVFVAMYSSTSAVIARSYPSWNSGKIELPQSEVAPYSFVVTIGETSGTANQAFFATSDGFYFYTHPYWKVVSSPLSPSGTPSRLSYESKTRSVTMATSRGLFLLSLSHQANNAGTWSSLNGNLNNGVVESLSYSGNDNRYMMSVDGVGVVAATRESDSSSFSFQTIQEDNHHLTGVFTSGATSTFFTSGYGFKDFGQIVYTSGSAQGQNTAFTDLGVPEITDGHHFFVANNVEASVLYCFNEPNNAACATYKQGTGRSTVSSSDGIHAAVFGGVKDSNADANVIFAAGPSKILTRKGSDAPTTATGPFTSDVVAVALDPTNYNNGLVISSSKIWLTNDFGATFTDVTVLTDLKFTACTIIHSGQKILYLIGTNKGLYVSEDPANVAWSRFGQTSDFPSVAVSSFSFDGYNLNVGTKGRGLFQISEPANYVGGVTCTNFIKLSSIAVGSLAFDPSSLPSTTQVLVGDSSQTVTIARSWAGAVVKINVNGFETSIDSDSIEISLRPGVNTVSFRVIASPTLQNTYLLPKIELVSRTNCKVTGKVTPASFAAIDGNQVLAGTVTTLEKLNAYWVLGTANSGVWTTPSLTTAASRNYRYRSGSLPCQSISALATHPSLKTTVIAGCGSASSYPAITSERLGVFVSQDSGVSWTFTNFPIGYDITDIAILDSDSWVVSASSSRADKGGIFVTHDTGATFTQTYQGVVHAVAADNVGTQVVFAAAATSGVLTSIDAGDTWNPVLGIDVAHNTVALMAGADIYASEQNGEAIIVVAVAEQYVNNGKTLINMKLYSTFDWYGNFTAIIAPTTASLPGYAKNLAVTANYDTGVWTVGLTAGNDVFTSDAGVETQFSNVWTTTASGADGVSGSWTYYGRTQSTFAHSGPRDIAFATSATGLVVATDGGMFFLDLNAGTWANINKGTQASLNLQNLEFVDGAVAPDNAAGILYGFAAWNGGLFSFTDANPTAAPFETGHGISLTSTSENLIGWSLHDSHKISICLGGSNPTQSVSMLSSWPKVLEPAYTLPLVASDVDPSHVYFCTNSTSVTGCYSQKIDSTQSIAPVRQGDFYGAFAWTGRHADHDYSNVFLGADNSGKVLSQDGFSAQALTRTLKVGSTPSTVSVLSGDYFTAVVTFSNAFRVDLKPQIFFTTNFGRLWTDITGNFVAVSETTEGFPSVLSSVIVPIDNALAIVLGTTQGIIVSFSTDPSNWVRLLPADVPNSPITSVQYVKSSDIIYFTSLGAGFFSISSGVTVLKSLSLAQSNFSCSASYTSGLADLKVDTYILSPSFKADVLSYSVKVPDVTVGTIYVRYAYFGTTSTAVVSATGGDTACQKGVCSATFSDGVLEMTVKIVVDGMEYTITISRLPKPRCSASASYFAPTAVVDSNKVLASLAVSSTGPVISGEITSIFFLSSWYALSRSGELWSSADLASWSQATLPCPSASLVKASGGRLFAVCKTAKFDLYVLDGSSWNKLYSFSGWSIIDIARSGDNIIVLVENDADAAWVSSNGGGAFTKQTTFSGNHVTNVFFTGVKILYVLESGTMFDGGAYTEADATYGSKLSQVSATQEANEGSVWVFHTGRDDDGSLIYHLSEFTSAGDNNNQNTLVPIESIKTGPSTRVAVGINSDTLYFAFTVQRSSAPLFATSVVAIAKTASPGDVAAASAFSSEFPPATTTNVVVTSTLVVLGTTHGVYKSSITSPAWVSANTGLTAYSFSSIGYDPIRGVLGAVHTAGGFFIQGTDQGTLSAILADTVSPVSLEYRDGFTDVYGGSLYLTAWNRYRVLAGSTSLGGAFARPSYYPGGMGQNNPSVPNALNEITRNSLLYCIHDDDSRPLQYIDGCHRVDFSGNTQSGPFQETDVYLDRFVYGGSYGDSSDSSVIFGTQNGKSTTYFCRSTAEGTVSDSSRLFSGSTGVALNPSDYHNAVVVSDGVRVSYTSDFCRTWSDITGDLLTVSSARKGGDAVVINLSSYNAIVVGTSTGLYATFSDSLGSWIRIGDSDFPNAVASSIKYYSSSNLLVVGTAGHGVYKIASITTILQSLHDSIESFVCGSAASGSAVLDFVSVSSTASLSPMFGSFVHTYKVPTTSSAVKFTWTTSSPTASVSVITPDGAFSASRSFQLNFTASGTQTVSIVSETESDRQIYNFFVSFSCGESVSNLKFRCEFDDYDGTYCPLDCPVAARSIDSVCLKQLTVNETTTLKSITSYCSGISCSASATAEVFRKCQLYQRKIDYDADTYDYVNTLVFPRVCISGCSSTFTTYSSNCFNQYPSLSLFSVNSFSDWCLPQDAPGKIDAVYSDTTEEADELSIYWSPPDNLRADPVLYEIQWSTDSPNTLKTQVIINSTKYLMQGLDVGSTYYIRARAVNQYGNGSYSDVISIPTPLPAPGAPDNLVATQPALGESDISVDLNWDASDYDGEFFVRYLVTRITVATNSTKIFPFATTNSLTDDAPLPETNYRYIVKAFVTIIANGTKPNSLLSSQIVTYITTNPVPPASPSFFGYGASIPTKVWLLWNFLSGTDCGGDCANIKYNIYVSTDDGDNWSRSIEVSRDASFKPIEALSPADYPFMDPDVDYSANYVNYFFADKDGLSSDQNYAFAVSAFNSAGESSTVEIFDVYVPGAPPSVTKPPTISALTYSSIQVALPFNGLTDPNGYVASAYLYVATSKVIDADHYVADFDLALDADAQNIEGLSPSTKYYAVWRVSSFFGDSELSAWADVTTPGRPPYIQSFVASGTTSSTKFATGATITITFDRAVTPKLGAINSPASLATYFKFSRPLPSTFTVSTQTKVQAAARSPHLSAPVASFNQVVITYSDVAADLDPFVVPVIGRFQVTQIIGSLVADDNADATDDADSSSPALSGSYSAVTERRFADATTTFPCFNNALDVSIPLSTYLSKYYTTNLATSTTAITLTVTTRNGTVKLSSSTFSMSDSIQGVYSDLAALVIHYQPQNSKFIGKDTIYVTLSDSADTPFNDFVHIPVKVQDYNNPPVITGPASYTIDVGSSVSITGVNITDPDLTGDYVNSPVTAYLYTYSPNTVFFLDSAFPSGVFSTVNVVGRTSSFVSLTGPTQALANYIGTITVRDPDLVDPSVSFSLIVEVYDNKNGGLKPFQAFSSFEILLQAGCSQLPAPTFKSTLFSDDLLSVRVVFKEKMFLDGSKTTCASIFDTDTVTSLGSGAECSQDSSSSIRISLGYGATIAVGSSVTFLATSGVSRCTNPDSPQLSGSSTVTKPLNPVSPVISYISGPINVGLCEDPTLDASVTGLGTGTATYAWSSSVSGVLPSDTNKVRITIPSGNMVPTKSYKISLQVTNWANKASEIVSITFFKSSSPTPVLLVTGESAKTFNTSESVTLVALGAFPSCYTDSTDRLVYRWSVSPAVTIADVDMTLRELAIPPFSLTASVFNNDKPYTFTVTTSYQNKPSISNKVSVTVYIRPSPLSVSISQGSLVRSTTAVKLFLDSVATDDDKQADGFTYSWSCLTSKNIACTNSLTRAPLAFDTTASVVVSRGALPSGTYKITVRVSKPNRVTVSSTASVILSAETAPTPIVSASINSKLISAVDSVTVSASAFDSSCADDTTTCSGFTFKWIQTSGDLDLTAAYVSGTDSSSLVINRDGASIWTRGRTYVFRAIVSNTYNQTGFGEASVTVRSAPGGGSLICSPDSGKPLDTDITCSAPGWSHPQRLSLSYEFLFINPSDGKLSSIIPKKQSTTATFKLPPGDKNNAWKLSVVVQVSDAQGSMTSATAIVVIDGSVIDLANLSDAIAQDNANKEKSGDYNGIAGSAGSAGSTANPSDGNKSVRRVPTRSIFSNGYSKRMRLQDAAQTQIITNSINSLSDNISKMTAYKTVMSAVQVLSSNPTTLTFSSMSTVSNMVSFIQVQRINKYFPSSSCASSDCRRDRFNDYKSLAAINSNLVYGTAILGVTPGVDVTALQSAIDKTTSSVQIVTNFLQQFHLQNVGEQYDMISDYVQNVARRDNRDSNPSFSVSNGAHTISIPNNQFDNTVAATVDTTVNVYIANPMSYVTIPGARAVASPVLQLKRVDATGSTLSTTNANPINFKIRINDNQNTQTAFRCLRYDTTANAWRLGGITSTVSSVGTTKYVSCDVTVDMSTVTASHSPKLMAVSAPVSIIVVAVVDVTNSGTGTGGGGIPTTPGTGTTGTGTTAIVSSTGSAGGSVVPVYIPPTSSDDDAGLIAGAVIGSIIGAVLIGAAVFYVYKRHQKGETDKQFDQQGGQDQYPEQRKARQVWEINPVANENEPQFVNVHVDAANGNQFVTPNEHFKAGTVLVQQEQDQQDQQEPAQEQQRPPSEPRSVWATSDGSQPAGSNPAFVDPAEYANAVTIHQDDAPPKPVQKQPSNEQLQLDPVVPGTSMEVDVAN